MRLSIPKWTAVLALGIVVCALAYIVTIRGYTLKLDGRVFMLEMHPGTQAPPPPSPAP